MRLNSNAEVPGVCLTGRGVGGVLLIKADAASAKYPARLEFARKRRGAVDR